MKILFVCKRRPQQRDLLTRPYGRFHYLPATLAALGHEVDVLLVGHSGDEDDIREFSGVSWHALDVRTHGLGLLAKMERFSAGISPDWVVGCSDTWFGWLAHRLSTKLQCRLAIDAYDDYEAYMRWNLPLHWRWRSALHAADVVTAAGPQLAEHLSSFRSVIARPVEVVPMAADPLFQPLDRAGCRSELGLPQQTPLIGYSGGWARERGTHVLMEAFARVRGIHPEVRLVLSGHPPAEVCAAPGVTALGYLADAQLPRLLNSLDVACVVTADSPFGRSSYPVKLCEAMACRIPVVATSTEPVRWMLDRDLRFLAEVGNSSSIAERLLANLTMDRFDYGKLPSWREAGAQFGEMLSN